MKSGRLEPRKIAELNNESARFAGRYCETRFRGGRDVEKHQVLNCVAHGYFCGFRWAETEFLFPSSARILVNWMKNKTLENFSDEALWNESIKASNHYVVQKGFTTIALAEQALIRATFSYGFRDGFRSARIHVYQ